jgi:4-diphosphocytidyl-2-C-methyl-D-erythritol kinase
MTRPGRAVSVQCPAKLNLFLEVVRRRPDGYHDLETVMQAVDLCDELRIEPRESGELALECSDPELPADERNLVLRAALALRERTGHRGGARFRLTKRVPAEAGLGGGSSDAAGTLVGLNAAWGLGLSRSDLAETAAEVGSDVAFFLVGGAALCTGRGEQVEPLDSGESLACVVLCPPVRVSTAAAYRALGALTSQGARATILTQALRAGDAPGVGQALWNRLEEPAFRLRPSLAEAKRQLAATGAFTGVGLTGSGSALFGVCRPEDLESAVQRVASLRLGRVFGVRSVAHGVRLLGD